MLVTTWIIVSLLVGLGLGSSWVTKDKKITVFTIFMACVWFTINDYIVDRFVSLERFREIQLEKLGII